MKQEEGVLILWKEVETRKVFKNKDKAGCQQSIYILSPSHNSINFMHKCLKYVDGLPDKSNPHGDHQKELQLYLKEEQKGNYIEMGWRHTGAEYQTGSVEDEYQGHHHT